jgi:hypothetical protein
MKTKKKKWKIITIDDFRPLINNPEEKIKMDQQLIFGIVMFIIGFVMFVRNKQITRLRGGYTGKKGEYSVEERQNYVKFTGFLFIIGGILLIIESIT